VTHFGAKNVEALIPRLKATLPRLRRVYLVGTSAGGFGAQLNFPRFAGAFQGVRVDVIADSAQLINPLGGLISEWVNNWGLEVPSSCVGCVNDFQRYVGFLLSQNPQSRFGLLASFRDSVLTPFFGYGINFEGYRSATVALLDTQYNQFSNGSYLARSGLRHGYLDNLRQVTTRTNNSTFEWVTQFLAGTAPNRRP
jgi:hypothetical protein